MARDFDGRIKLTITRIIDYAGRDARIESSPSILHFDLTKEDCAADLHKPANSPGPYRPRDIKWYASPNAVSFRADVTCPLAKVGVFGTKYEDVAVVVDVDMERKFLTNDVAVEEWLDACPWNLDDATRAGIAAAIRAAFPDGERR